MAGDICLIGRVKIEFVNGSVCSAGLTTLGAAAAVPQTNKDAKINRVGRDVYQFKTN